MVWKKKGGMGRPRTKGKQWYGEQVCYEPMQPTPSRVHKHRCGNQVCLSCEGGRRRDHTYIHMHTYTNHAHISIRP